MAPNKNDLDYSNRRYGAWRQAQKTITFNGSVSGGTGDYDGVGNPFSIFDITGDVKAKIIGVCTTTLSGASAILEVGVTGNLSGIIAQTTATDIDASEIWHDASPDSPIELETVMPEDIIANGLDVVGTVSTANIVSGAIRFTCLWRPLSTDGEVVAA